MTMVNSVSNVRFCANEGASVLSRPGKYSGNPAAAPAVHPEVAAPVQNEKKSSHALLKTIAGLVVAAGVLAALPKVFPKTIKTLEGEALKSAKWYEKIAHYTAEAGNAIYKYTCGQVVKLFKGKKPEAPVNA